jgi:hypothetical protein
VEAEPELVPNIRERRAELRARLLRVCKPHELLKRRYIENATIRGVQREFQQVASRTSNKCQCLVTALNR